MSKIRGNGLYVSVAGRWFSAYGPDLREPSVSVDIGDEDRPLFREVHEPPPRLIARVHADEMEALVSVTTRGQLDGKDVSVEALDDDSAFVYFNGSPRLAELYGLDGSPHDGCAGRVPRDAVTDIVTSELDLLAR